MATQSQASNSSISHDEHDNSLKIKNQSLSPIRIQQPVLTNTLFNDKLSHPTGLRGGGACFDCLACICCCCALEELCCECCQTL